MLDALDAAKVGKEVLNLSCMRNKLNNLIARALRGWEVMFTRRDFHQSLPSAFPPWNGAWVWKYPLISMSNAIAISLLPPQHNAMLSDILCASSCLCEWQGFEIASFQQRGWRNRLSQWRPVFISWNWVFKNCWACCRNPKSSPCLIGNWVTSWLAQISWSMQSVKVASQASMSPIMSMRGLQTWIWSVWCQQLRSKTVVMTSLATWEGRV